MTDSETPPPKSRWEEYPAATEPPPPSFGDAIRFLHRKRVRLAAHFTVFLTIGIVAFLIWLAVRPRVVEGRMALTFRGIETGEYPSGRHFSTEDLRAPSVLRAALADAGLKDQVDPHRLSANMTITRVIPAEVLGRWKKQDRDGVKREEYVPNEFEVLIGLRGVPAQTQMRLFDAVIKRYRDYAKFEQTAALRFVSDWSRDQYANMLKQYDYWELPYLLEQNIEILTTSLRKLIEESKDYKDSSLQLSFRDIQKDLDIWTATRLEALRAQTYQGGLVRNKNVALLTSRSRLEEMTIAARARGEETEAALRLLEALQRPQPVVTTQSGQQGIPMVDSAVVDRILKSDYLTPLVKRISLLQEETKRMEAMKWRLEKQMTQLPSAHNIREDELPKDYTDLISALSKDLSKIIENYKRVLDDYLTETITDLVMVKEGPRLSRGVSTPVVLGAILFCAAVLALFSVVLEHLIISALRRAS